MRKARQGEENEDFQEDVVEVESVKRTPRKSLRIITDRYTSTLRIMQILILYSDDDGEETWDTQPTRRSSRIPALQQKRQEKFHKIVYKSGSDNGNSLLLRTHD